MRLLVLLSKYYTGWQEPEGAQNSELWSVAQLFYVVEREGETESEQINLEDAPQKNEDVLSPSLQGKERGERLVGGWEGTGKGA